VEIDGFGGSIVSIDKKKLKPLAYGIVYLLTLFLMVYPVLIIPNLYHSPDDALFYRILARYDLPRLEATTVYVVCLAVLSFLLLKCVRSFRGAEEDDRSGFQ